MTLPLSKTPLVSVCIVCFSPGEVFRSTLRSVQDQTYKHLEILILDNAPDGKIEEILCQYKDPRIQYFSSPENL